MFKGTRAVCRLSVFSYSRGIEVRRRHKSVVPFLDYLNLIILKCQFENCNNMVIHELGGDGTAAQPRELLLDEADILSGLDNADLILAALGLNRDHIVASALVDPDVEFVDLDLADPLDRRPKMVLQAVGRQPEEGVDQAVIPDDGEKRLFVVQGISPDDFGGRVGDRDPRHIRSRHDAVDPH